MVFRYHAPYPLSTSGLKGIEIDITLKITTTISSPLGERIKVRGKNYDHPHPSRGRGKRYIHRSWKARPL